MAIPGDSRPDAPKKWVRVTTLVIFGLLAILFAYDAVVANNPWRGDTVSELTMWAALRSFTLPFAWGHVSGHLFWAGKYRRSTKFVLIYSAIITTLLLALDALTWAKVISLAGPIGLIRQYPIVMVTLGILSGRLFWPQVRQ